MGRGKCLSGAIDMRLFPTALGPKLIGPWSWLEMPDPEVVVRKRILALVDYLYRIQEK